MIDGQKLTRRNLNGDRILNLLSTIADMLVNVFSIIIPFILLMQIGWTAAFIPTAPPKLLPSI